MFLSDELEKIATHNTQSVEMKSIALELMKKKCIEYSTKPCYTPLKVASIWDAVAILLKKKKIDTFVREGQMDVWAKNQETVKQS